MYDIDDLREQIKIAGEKIFSVTDYEQYYHVCNVCLNKVVNSPLWGELLEYSYLIEKRADDRIRRRMSRGDLNTSYGFTRDKQLLFWRELKW